MTGLRVAVLGATGAVGREVRRLLAERAFPLAGDPVMLASARSAGTSVEFAGRDVEVREVTEASFADVDIAIFSAGATRSRQWAQIAADAGAVVVDNSSAFRMDPDVPLVVSEVNPEAIAERPRGVIANPNCTTMVLMVAAKPLHDRFGLRSMVATSYQAAGGAGMSGIDELMGQVAGLAADPQRLVNDGAKAEAAAATGDGVFSKPLAFNVLAHCGAFLDDRYTEEEHKLVNESRKILGLADLSVSPTCVRVPVVVGHAIAARLTFDRPVDRDEAINVLLKAPGLVVEDGTGLNGEALEYPTPLASAGRDEVFIGRVRQDLADANSLNVFVVGDNLKKGAALNAVQIAEIVAAELAG